MFPLVSSHMVDFYCLLVDPENENLFLGGQSKVLGDYASVADTSITAMTDRNGKFLWARNIYSGTSEKIHRCQLGPVPDKFIYYVFTQRVGLKEVATYVKLSQNGELQWHARVGLGSAYSRGTTGMLGFVVDPDTQSLYIHFRVFGVTSNDALGQDLFNVARLNAQGNGADWGKMTSGNSYHGGDVALDPTNSSNVLFVFGRLSSTRVYTAILKCKKEDGAELFYKAFKDSRSNGDIWTAYQPKSTALDSEGNIYIFQRRALGGSYDTHLQKHRGVDGTPLVAGYLDTGTNNQYIGQQNVMFDSDDILFVISQIGSGQIALICFDKNLDIVRQRFFARAVTMSYFTASIQIVGNNVYWLSLLEVLEDGNIRSVVFKTDKLLQKNDGCYELSTDATGWTWSKTITITVWVDIATLLPLRTMDVSKPVFTFNDPIQNVELDHTKLYFFPDTFANCIYPTEKPMTIPDQAAYVGNTVPLTVSLSDYHCQGIPFTHSSPTQLSFFSILNNEMVFSPMLNTDAGQHTITVTITDPVSDTTTASYLLEVFPNRVPSSDPIPVDQSIWAFHDFSYALKITDIEQNAITIEVKKSDSSARTQWLTWDDTSQTFSGTPKNSDV